MRRFRLIVLPAVLLLVAVACAGDDGDGDGGGGGQGEDTGTINVLSSGDPGEAEAYNAIIDDLINSQTDYVAEIEASGEAEQQFQIRAQAGTLDVYLLPQPGTVAQLVQSGNLTSLEDMGFDIAELEGLFGEYFVALGEVDGQHYGLPTNINLKSMVWYPKDDFDAAGYQVPTTWDDMLALSDQIVADGGTPWCIGIESEAATGWPATDWIEDIMLRTAGLDVYTQWYTHEIPFNDPAVLSAAQIFGDVVFHEGYVLGGAKNIPALAFGEAPLPLFNDPPGCWLHRQASFIPAFFPEGVEAGVDYDWFPLPPIDQEGTLFAGELAVVGTGGNRPEVKDFLDRFMAAEVQCAFAGEPASSRISPNINVGPDCYTNQLLADSAAVLTDALANGTGGFDASDLMPAAVGTGSFWTGMVDYMRNGPDSIEGILEEIEAGWPAE
ncbi:MAG: ABC transporter substrate-binding protein [Actinomycetota bacterium]